MARSYFEFWPGATSVWCPNLVPRVSLLPAKSDRKEIAFGGKKRDHGNEVVWCPWARHFDTLTVPLSTQEYQWVPPNCYGNALN